MTELPWFPLYARDWLSGEGTSMMLPEQEGPFIRLLCIAWGDGTQEPSIPDDDAALATMTRLGARWKKHGPLLRAQFVAREGRLYNAKLTSIWNEQRSKSAKLAEAGRKGGRAKAGLQPGHDEASSETLANAKHTETEADTETETAKASRHDTRDESAIAIAELAHLLTEVPGATDALTGFMEGLPSSTKRLTWARSLITSLHPIGGGKPVNPVALVAAMADFNLSDRSRFPHSGAVFRAFVDKAARDLDTAAIPISRGSAVPHRENWTEKKTREDNEESDRQLARVRAGNVDTRRGAVDGSLWYARMQREAKALGKNVTLYAYDRMHEPAEVAAHA